MCCAISGAGSELRKRICGWSLATFELSPNVESICGVDGLWQQGPTQVITLSAGEYQLWALGSAHTLHPISG